MKDDKSSDDLLEVTDDDPIVPDPVPPVSLGPVPSVCRSVHYVAFGTPGGEYTAGAHRAAIITEVHDTTPEGKSLRQVGLIIFNPTGIHFREFVSQDEGKKKPGTWHWPEIVK